jgi:hypothetical protein
MPVVTVGFDVNCDRRRRRITGTGTEEELL